MKVRNPSKASLWSALSIFALCSPNRGMCQYAVATAPVRTQLYILCSLVDDPHKTVYYSGVFQGVEPALHVYEKSFSTHLEMNLKNVIGTAKCSSYQNERGAKASMASLQENWRWIYKTNVNTQWNYVPLTKYSQP